MALFNRKKRQEEAENTQDQNGDNKKEKGAWKKPANTAFKQQRLKAWQPILTPRTVLPTLFLIGIIFAPIGGLLIWGSGLVTQITINYTDCERATGGFVQVSDYDYRLRSSESSAPFNPPFYQFTNNTSAPRGQQNTCTIRFEIPYDLKASVFTYYKLTSFYQNHRRYVQSLDADQLKGKKRSAHDLEKSNCKPIDSLNGKPIYPCGLIANSIFNDTIGNLVLLDGSGNPTTTTYNFSAKGIAWPGEKKKYSAQPGYDSLSDIVPPPNWQERYPDGYTEANPPPNLREDEHFQNWMRTAGLPTFTKLYGRNDADTLAKGIYEVVIISNFPVTPYGGTKSIVISTVAWVGGKNPFLGWAYVGAAGLFIVLAIAGTIRHLIRPRKLGDMSLLSWNQPGATR